MNLIYDHHLDFALLQALTERPPLYARSQHYIWTDDHVGRQMLAFHLDPDIDSASLKHSTIDRQVAWIARRAGAPEGKALLDIGCGPGLYCERFHGAGFRVTGMDFNRRSIDYARNNACKGGLPIEYEYGNYVHMRLHEAFDVVTLINRDFGALTASERDSVIRAVYDCLRPGGLFVFDTLSVEYFRRLTETHRFLISAGEGFWAAGPHLVLERTHLYAEDHVQLDQYAVVEADGTVRSFHNWLTYYTEAEIERILSAARFDIVEANPFLSDEEYGDPECYLGFVAAKR
ncbi:MAG: class I SAM-dependent methyltransferase [Spirochaetales bacterium]|nr:class I SAM-dependent methyltransferase [Spirochaetales bacterium]